MENASKALIMAAGILIAIVIIGALLLMFNSLSSYQGEDTQTIREAQLVEFNKHYETYNRKNVRGSDLYSLLNKVIDYNRRKSSVGTGEKDQGQYLAYEPMTISFSFNGKRAVLAYGESNQIFTNDVVTLTEANTNEFEKNVNEKVNEAIAIAQNEVAMRNLASGISNLFDKTSPQDQLKAVKLWNANAKQTIENIGYYDEIINTPENKKKVYTYYEFMQFKRANFDCIKVEYNEGTGRIIKLEFEFNGKIN